jgi:ubiquinone biosynthesis protein
MSSRLSPRYRQIATTLRRHGMGVALGLARVGWLIPFHRGAMGHERRAEPYTSPEHVRLALEQLGPTFIKLGQLLSTRTDLLGEEYTGELSRLQDDAPPVAADAIRAVILQELGQDPDALFAAFDLRPLASASIGQAHAAVLQDGTPVVVKVRRPGVVEEIEQDLAILHDIVARAARRSEAPRYDLSALVAEFAATIRAELDYVQEARNAERFRLNFSDDPMVAIPRVFPELSTSKVLTMERMHGIKIDDLQALDRAGIDRAALAADAASILLRMIFTDRFYHADPHPGNLFVRPDGGIELIDFGMVGEVGDALQERLATLFLALVREDPQAMSDAILSLSLTREHADPESLTTSVSALIASYSGRSLGQIDVGAVLRELLAVVREQGLQMPRQLVTLFRVLLIADGIGVRLDPDFDLGTALTPYAEQLARERSSFWSSGRRAAVAATEAGDLLLALPTRVRDLLERAGTSGIVVKVRLAELDSSMRRLERIGNRVLATLLAAAFIRGIGEVVSRDRKWRVWEGAMMGTGLAVVSTLSGYLVWTGRRRRRRR